MPSDSGQAPEEDGDLLCSRLSRRNQTPICEWAVNAYRRAIRRRDRAHLRCGEIHAAQRQLEATVARLWEAASAPCNADEIR
jgi:hypothetical protein